MTYSIAAPMLYKEVVVNNLASFFLGVDDPVKEHHQACISYPNTQTRLCHHIKKKDGTMYHCPRHNRSHQPDHQISTSTPPPFAFPLYHKQELLAMVEAIHIVYASVDKYVYGGIDYDACASGDDHDFSFSDLCDVRRYKDYPECAKEFSSKNTPLVNLKRATVGRWMSDYWDSQSPIKPIWQADFHDSESEVDLGEFEDDLADNHPRIHPRFMCRYPNLGPLDRYPSTHGKIEINVLHNPDLDQCCDNLLVGALNISFVSG
jgi:hypothetical protein